MSDAYLGEIRAFAFGIVPDGWAACDGSLLSIADHGPLYSLLGTSFGGDGRTTFGTPDLRGRAVVSDLKGRGTKVGLERVSLADSQLPEHQHLMVGSNEAVDAGSPQGSMLGVVTWDRFAKPGGGKMFPMRPESVGETGGGAHENRQPFLVVNYCIALEGDWPPRDEADEGRSE